MALIQELHPTLVLTDIMMELTRFWGSERRCRPNDVPMLTMMTFWQWDSPRETTKNLIQPEVARYVIRMTMELADILGIPLEEAQHG